MGWEATAHTLGNLERERECVFRLSKALERHHYGLPQAHRGWHEGRGQKLKARIAFGSAF
jgi:hypothetical protein